MIIRTRPDQVSSGEAIGILLLDTSVPFIPGDVANATTYSYPVRFKRVDGFTVCRALDKDPAIYDLLLTSARELVGQGVRAVTGDCGFMGIHQQRLARDLGVPVFLSSLSQIPFISIIIGDGARIGVITANAKSLDERLLRAVGVTDSSNLAIAGLEDQVHFHAFAIEETGWLDTVLVGGEVVAAAEKLVREHADVRAILLECSLLPPYAASVQEATGLPVFDYITMIDFVFHAVVKTRHQGFV